MRAFACAVLLRTAAEPGGIGCFGGETETLAQLIASSLTLGSEVIEAARSCLAWRLPLLNDDEYDDSRCFFGLGIVVLSLARPPFGASEQEKLVQLIDWIIMEESRYRTVSPTKSDEWLMGLTYHDLSHDKWRGFVRQFFLDETLSLSDDLSIRLRNVASRILPSG